MKPSLIKYVLLSAMLFCGPGAMSCINEYRALLKGGTVFTQVQTGPVRIQHYLDDTDNYVRKLFAADSTWKATGRIEDYSDYGAMLVYNRQYADARTVFIEIEAKQPGLYATAANLGTTYELLGRNDSALYWIEKAIAINPGSHDSSEWIHVNILKAKIEANGNDAWYATHHIVPVDMGDGEIPESKTSIDLKTLETQLRYQLGERMSFVQPKDPVVAHLLFELGNITAVNMDVKSALLVYEQAIKYGYSSPVMTKRIAYFEALQQKAETKNAVKDAKTFVGRHMTLLVASAFVLLAVVVFILWKLKKRKK